MDLSQILAASDAAFDEFKAEQEALTLDVTGFNDTVSALALDRFKARLPEPLREFTTHQSSGLFSLKEPQPYIVAIPDRKQISVVVWFDGATRTQIWAEGVQYSDLETAIGAAKAQA